MNIYTICNSPAQLPAVGKQANFLYVPESHIMYLSDFCWFLLCTRGRERGAGEGGLEGGGWREAGERGMESISFRINISVSPKPHQLFSNLDLGPVFLMNADPEHISANQSCGSGFAETGSGISSESGSGSGVLVTKNWRKKYSWNFFYLFTIYISLGLLKGIDQWEKRWVESGSIR